MSPDVNHAMEIERQPEVVTCEVVDGIGVVAALFHQKGEIIPQHAHAYPHISVIGAGSVRVWKDGVWSGTYKAPQQIVIEAGVKHLFHVLEDKTVVLCVHNVSRSGSIDVLEEHHIVTEV